MTAARVIVFALLLAGITCSYALPLRVAIIYGPPSLLAMPVLVRGFEEPRVGTDEESKGTDALYTLNGDLASASSFNVVKRNVQGAADGDGDDGDDDDLETAAGSNVLRPLFVYRQQIAYRQRAREAIRRGRRI
ncbi:hypothetical protein EAI_00461 [Harpegnathos saltator]|uniref:Uncharacterized protein n=1 Tax=Harpegnathos saltator TaxID=610380 RepID=E2BKB0_HARSA|nr:hypothetical protein EAI_00461 [Harpegnathos saltator]